MPLQKARFPAALKSWAAPKKHFLAPVAILLVGLLLATGVFLVAVQPLLDAPTQKGELGTGIDGKTPALQPGDGVEQLIDWPDALAGFAVVPYTFSETVKNITLNGVVMDGESGAVLCTFGQSYRTVAHRKALMVTLEQPVQAPSGVVRIALSAQGFSAEKTRFHLTFSGDSANPCVVRGEEQPRSLRLLLYGTSGFLAGYYWALALPLVALAVLLWVMIFTLKARPQNVFLLAAIGLGLAFSFAFPPYAMNDESAHHIPNTFYYAGRMMGQPAMADGTFENRAEDVPDGFANAYPQREQYYRIYTGLFQPEQTPGETITSKVRLVGQPYQYLPQAAGVALARLLGLGQVGTLYMGRLLALLVHVAVLYATIRLVPFKTLFVLVGLIPYTLYLSGGFTYDLSIITLCTFFIGYVFYLAYAKPKMTWLDIAVLAVAGLLLAPLKYIYIPVLLVPLIIPKAKWWRPWLKTVFCVVLAVGGALVLGVFVVSRLQYDPTWLATEKVETPWLDPEGAYTYGSLLQQPATLVRLLVATAVDGLGEILLGMGAVQYYELPLWLSCAFAVLLVFSGFPVKGQSESPLLVARGQKVVLGLAALGVYLLALVAALAWTYVGSYYIRGAQDRYFVAILPLLVLLASGLFTRKKNSDRALVYTAVWFNIYAVFYIFLAGIANRGALRGGV